MTTVGNFSIDIGN